MCVEYRLPYRQRLCVCSCSNREIVVKGCVRRIFWTENANSLLFGLIDRLCPWNFCRVRWPRSKVTCTITTTLILEPSSCKLQGRFVSAAGLVIEIIYVHVFFYVLTVTETAASDQGHVKASLWDCWIAIAMVRVAGVSVSVSFCFCFCFCF